MFGTLVVTALWQHLEPYSSFVSHYVASGYNECGRGSNPM